MPNGHKPEPCCFVLFGATGDLTHRLVIPALYNLLSGNLLPDNFCVVGIARKGMTNQQLTESLQPTFIVVKMFCLGAECEQH